MANRTVTAELEMKGRDSTGPMWKSVAARMGGIERQMGRFNQTASQFNSKIASIERANSAMAKVSRGVEASSAGAIASLARFAAPAAIAYGVKQAVVSFADMERHMTRIGITAEASKGEIADATKEVERLSTSMGYKDFQPAMTALDTLVSSGMDLKTAMAFLPSVMATAQASGAETEDIANAGLKTASAFKLQASDMQKAFDDMAFSGKQGQFELKDMARYIPSLASSFSALGYTGEDGLKRLLAIMQTIRSQTGTAEEAATDAQNIFGKIFSQETIGKFKKFGIDLDKELKNAKKNGEDLMDAFVRLSKEAIKGDLSKLPLLFGDQQVRLGMLALINGSEELIKQLKALDSTRVNGTVLRDLGTVLQDTQAKIDRFNANWEKFKNNVGGAAAGPVGTILEVANNTMEREDAIAAGIKKANLTPDELTKYYISKGQGGSEETALMDRYFAFLGDPNNERLRSAYMADFADTPQMKKMHGRAPTSFIAPPDGAIDHGYTPSNLPKVGPYPMPGNAPRDQYMGGIYNGTGGRISPPTTTDFTSTVGAPGEGIDWKKFFFGDGKGLIEGMKMDMSDSGFMQEAGQQAGQALGQAASEKISSDASSAGQSFGQSAGAAILGILNSWKPNINISGYSGNQGVNANVGKPAAAAAPPPSGGGW